MKIKHFILLLTTLILAESCDYFSNPNDKMIKILEAKNRMYDVRKNPFATNAEILYLDSIIKNSYEGHLKLYYELNKGNALLKLGKESEAVSIMESAIKRQKAIDGRDNAQSLNFLAIAYMRLAEKQNCVNYHNPESCIIPIQKSGIHTIRQGSQKAIEIYKKLLDINPNDYESRWLLNIAYMTIDGYPSDVPEKWLIPNLNKENSTQSVKPFVDVAANVGIKSRNMSGGVIIDDFNNDNYLDIVTSDWSLDGVMHYYQNDQKGKYIDYSKASQIGRFKGGLNMIQADYDNDGDTDIFVLRGAWMRKFGRQPNSLLRNNGDGTFTDVTIKSGLYSEFPTQAGAWNDFNNDGYLDLFIGNESSDDDVFPSELYLNNQDGTFTNVAKAAKCDVISYIKGVTSADYDNDGDIDLFLSGMNKRKIVLKNTGLKNGIPQFIDVTDKAGLAGINVMTFPTWFWDYDNDGWQDIFVCGYQYEGSVGGEVAMEALNIPNNSSKMYLYRNNHDGTFSDVSKVSGVNKTVLAMGSNFGDIDNDGFLDMYLGTGNPDYKSLIPNKLFRNMGDGKFADVTVSARVGNLQKGHGVALNDLDNDGDTDIFIEVGGAYAGDAFSNSLYLNPGQNTNRWIKLKLEGKASNRSAIGTKIKVSFKENGVSRSVYRVVNSGGSFGASALRMEIGVGKATIIDQIEITWPKNQKKEVFRNIKPNQYIKIIEGEKNFSKINIKKQFFLLLEQNPQFVSDSLKYKVSEIPETIIKFLIMKNKKIKIILFSLLSLLMLVRCSTKDSDEKIFSTLDRADTGIDFSNNLTENDSLNYFTYHYIYLGGGVATGDINNDGLADIFFTGNQVSNKLYLNKGNLKFEDITKKAGVGGDDRWYNGVTMADVNGDGFLDIYCSVSGKFGPKNNQLYINNGNGTFTEKAKEYGIDDAGDSTQGTFFDYDKDGDLDLFVANYPPTKFNSATTDYVQMMLHVKDNESGHLYRNDGNHFANITQEAGLKAYGLSLSATIGDLNNDNWPDIYVSNDFNSPDFMYINNQDGTFKEVVKQAMAHNSFYGMGVDISDFNNDGNLDVFQVDMDAKDNRRKKANMSSMNPQLFWDVVDAGFNYQYMHNCMQLNTGVNENGIPHFGNISRITGTSSTDWSWGPLFADFDNDGNKDLFVSNGTRREINNNDFFNSFEALKERPKDLLKKSQEIPSEKIDNFMFQNKGNLHFEQVNKKWGIEYKGFSNGVAYVDLDNDGDLDLVVNNIDDYASVFENSSSKINNYIKIKFKGNSKNTYGLGNRVYIKTKKGTQMQELTLTRGFQSSVSPELHFGLAKDKTIDEVKVVWTNGKVQKLYNVRANQTLNFKEQDSKEETAAKTIVKNTLFKTENGVFPVFKHEENKYDDFKDQVLLPHKMSTFGPTICVGDLNKDGLDDYFIGGSSGYTGKIFLQTQNGFTEKKVPALEEDEFSEDTGSLIFDADNDGDNDLYVVSGGYEFLINDPKLQDRLYLNNGKGDFTKASKGVLPTMLTSSSKVYSIDYDKDGKKDLLVLGRQVPGQYPSPTTTYLLHNISTADQPRFELSKKAPKEFINLGMATSAVITDFNNDKSDDIIIVGEWMPIRAFQNTKTGFKEVTKNMGLTDDTTGWWWSIQQGDFDKDGDMDYIVGNNGLNYKYQATPNETFDIFVKDFDNDKHKDIVLSYYNDGKQYPVRGRGCSSQQIPNIKKKFKDYESFSQATLVDVYTEKSLKEALHYKVKSFASIYLENRNGKFIIHKLPINAQISCINQIAVEDFDKDGNLDALITGNMFNSEVETPRNDAGHGLFLKGNGKGAFTPVSAVKSGFFTPGDVKNMEKIKVKDKNYFLITKNNSFLQTIRIN